MIETLPDLLRLALIERLIQDRQTEAGYSQREVETPGLLTQIYHDVEQRTSWAEPIMERRVRGIIQSHTRTVYYEHSYNLHQQPLNIYLRHKQVTLGQLLIKDLVEIDLDDYPEQLTVTKEDGGWITRNSGLMVGKRDITYEDASSYLGLIKFTQNYPPMYR